MRYDPELQLAKAFKAALAAYLTDTKDSAGNPVQAYHGFDIIDLKAAKQHVVASALTATGEITSPGNFRCEVEVTVSTDFTGDGQETDSEAHFALVSAVRDWLMTEDLATRLFVEGFGVEFVFPSRKFTSGASLEEGFFHSKTNFTVGIYST